MQAPLAAEKRTKVSQTLGVFVVEQLEHVQESETQFCFVAAELTTAAMSRHRFPVAMRFMSTMNAQSEGTMLCFP